MNKFPTEKLTVDIESVFPNSWNPNQQDEFTYDKAKKSIEKYGFIDPVLVRRVDKIYEIIDGEHRWRAAKELGYTEILVEDYGEITVNDAKVLTMNLNLRGKDDVLKRAELFKSLNSDQLSLLPFEDSQIKEEMELLDFDFDQFEGTEAPDEDKDRIKKVLGTVTNLEKLLRDLHSKSESSEVRLICEYYFDLNKKIIDLIK